MAVAQASAMDSETAVIAFASNGTKNPDAFIVTNISHHNRKVAVTIKGSNARSFEAFRTTKSPEKEDIDLIDEAYLPLGQILVQDGRILVNAPAGSVTTFFAL